MQDELFYLYGKISISISVSDSLKAYFPPNFEKYRIGAFCSEDADVKLFVDDCLTERKQLPGWSLDHSGAKYFVSYRNDTELLFQLEYDPLVSKRVWVHANSKYAKSITLGIQYGVMLALNGKCIGLHGVTVICGNQAIILSAPSGTGKTTLAKLLQKHCEAAIINGDFALLSLSTEYGVLFEPTPFCGTSKTCHNYRLPISHIVFLEQAKETCISKVSLKEALKHILSNTFIPEWDGKLQQTVESVGASIIEQVPMISFSFPPTKEAAEKLFAYISS